MTGQIVTRPMQRHDVTAVATIHLEAFKGYANAALGPTYARAFLAQFLDSDDVTAHVACMPSGIIVGYVLGATPVAESRIQTEMRAVAMKSILKRPWSMLHRSALRKVGERAAQAAGINVLAPVKPPVLSPSMFGLIAIGTSHLARGRQVGAALMRAFEDAATAREANVVFLSVYRENKSARRLYLAQGWRVVEGDHFRGRADYFAKTLARTDGPQPVVKT